MSEAEQTEIFERWIAKYKALLFKVVRAYAFTPMDRDDLFQETAVQVWRSIPSFRHESAVTTWLYRVSLNTAMTWTRKERKHASQTEAVEAQHVLDEQLPEDPRLEWLYHEIGKLNEVDRSVALLLLDGFTYDEMSEILGISASNVGVKIHRLKNHLINRSKENQSWNSTK